MIRAADDFSAIRSRLAELEAERLGQNARPEGCVCAWTLQALESGAGIVPVPQPHCPVHGIETMG